MCHTVGRLSPRVSAHISADGQADCERDRRSSVRVWPGGRRRPGCVVRPSMPAPNLFEIEAMTAEWRSWT